MRLTVWYLTLLGATLAGVAAFVLIRVHEDLRAHLDRRTALSAFQIARGYSQEGATDFYDVSNTVLPVTARGPVASQALDARGRVVLSFGDAVSRRPLISPRDAQRILRSGARRLSVRAGRRWESFSVYATPVTVHGQPGVVVVAASLRAVDGSVHRLLMLLLLAFAVALLFAAASGWWLARKALRPVAAMTRRAQNLGVQSLDQRLELPRTRDELWDLAATLNGMFDSIERAVGTQKRLVADAAHELRTPLTVMRSSVDVRLMESDLDATTRDVLESVRNEVLRLSRLVEDLLTLAHFDEHKIELRRAPVGLREVAEEVVARLDSIATERDLEIAVTGPVAIVDGDRRRLVQVVVNLIENAIRHSPAGGSVAIETWSRDGTSGMTVTDEGPGIPADAAVYVFDRFFHIDSARDRSGEGGLGRRSRARSSTRTRARSG
jgi:signal transduction histidine kinase